MGAIPLPTADSLKFIIPSKYTFMNCGFYFFLPLSDYDKRDFSLFIINTETNEAVFYLEIM